MKKRILFGLILCTLFFNEVQSQKAPIKFGGVSIEELKQTVYPKDSSAAAYVIADFGESNLEYDQRSGFYIDFTRIKRIKILKKDGYDEANQSISLYQQNTTEEKLNTLKAVTYNLEGGKIVETKMKNDAVFREKVDANRQLIKFTLPNVKEGSVIEFSYKVYSEFIFNFQDWDFQSTIPVQWSEYRVRIPEYFTYDQYMQGYVPLIANETGEKRKTVTLQYRESGNRLGNSSTTSQENVDYMETFKRWAAKDVPAFKEEPYMNNYRDYMSRINFELVTTQFPGQSINRYMGTWESLNKEFLTSESFGGSLNEAQVTLGRIIETICGGVTDPAEKLAKVYQYVKENVSWDGQYRKFVSDNFKKILENKKGSAADINLLLTALLRKADITADPVLISTRNHGAVREQIALSGQFNYVIVCARIGDKKILLDATEKSLPLNLLPERCLNGKGYVISAERQGWINLTTNVKSKSISSFDLTLAPSGELSGQLTFLRDGYAAQSAREKYQAKGHEGYVSDLASTSQWNLSKSTFENVKALDQPLKEIHEIKLPEHTQVAGDVIYLNPLQFGRLEENPFKLENRVYPVDFGSPSEQTQTGKYTIPAGYVVEELPKPKVLMLPNAAGKYTYSTTLLGDKIQVTSQLLINQPLFSQLEYKDLREFYTQVVAKQAEQIVIKKKTE